MAVRVRITSIPLMFLLLCSALLATTLQGVQGEVEVEGPSESECRPYIEKALKKLETGDTQSADVQDDDITHIVTTDDSDTKSGDEIETIESKSVEDRTQEIEDEQTASEKDTESVEVETATEETDVTGDTQEVSVEEKGESEQAETASEEKEAETEETTESAEKYVNEEEGASADTETEEQKSVEEKETDEVSVEQDAAASVEEENVVGEEPEDGAASVEEAAASEQQEEAASPEQDTAASAEQNEGAESVEQGEGVTSVEENVASAEQEGAEESAASKEIEDTISVEQSTTEEVVASAEQEETAASAEQKDTASAEQEEAASNAVEDTASVEQEEGTAPSAEEDAADNVEEGTIDAEQEDTAASVEENAASAEQEENKVPSAEEEVAASEEQEGTVPSAEQEAAVSAEQEEIEGSVEQEGTASVEQEGATSIEEEAATSTEKVAASAEEGVPSAEDNAPSAEEGAPSAEEGAPSAEEGAPSTEEGAPSVEEGAPSVEEGASSVEEGVPSTEGVEQEASSEKEDNIEKIVETGSVEIAEDDGEKKSSDEEKIDSVEKQETEEKSEEVVKTETESAEDEQPEKASEQTETEPTPEEDLTWEVEIPSELRPRDHLNEILELTEEPSETNSVILKAAEKILNELKKIYENAIKPLETLYKYRDLSNRHFGDPEIFSKPLVLFMGPWSGGKSSIINYLLDNEYKQTSLRTGAEPSPAYFNLLMWGEEPEVLDGTQLAADWTFSGLQKFGQGLEERLRGLKLPNKLLEKINIVEIPGILEVRKQVSRMFPFNDACQWFIDRADIIFLVYDPSKLDVGPETEAILDQLKGREYQTRIILNKADQVKPEELMRVQGALIWNISPLMSSAQPPVMYSTSLWSKPYEVGAPIRLLHAQERAFLKDLKTAVDKRIENKIASARRFAVRVRNHAKMVDCYLTTYYNHKSVFGNKKLVSDQIIEHPQDYHIYEGLSTLTNISRYDLPDPDVYRDFFRLNPLYDFQQLSATCTYFRGCPINRLDVAIAYDLPELVGKYKKMIESVTNNADSSTKS